jgi:predicted RNA-binding protein with EMAP domain
MVFSFCLRRIDRRIRLLVSLKAVAKSLKIIDTPNSTGLDQKQINQARITTIGGN